MLNEDRDALVALTPDGGGLIHIFGLGGAEVLGASSNFGSEETIERSSHSHKDQADRTPTYAPRL